MKRYKLLKDLPYAKAGEVFERKIHKSKNGLSDYDYLEIRKRVNIGEDETRFGIQYNGFLNNFNEWFEEVKETGWKPKTGDKYWYIADCGIVVCNAWRNGIIDNARYELGNCYRTEEEAEHAKKVQIARTKIKRSSNFVPDWDNKCQEKFFVYLNHFAKYLDVGNTVSYNTIGQIVFYQTRKDAERAIEEFRQDYFLHFGVEQ